MVKISAKLIKQHKTVAHYDLINVNEYDEKDFYYYLTVICDNLDIAVPVVIPYHVTSYGEYNFVKFRPDDFIEAFKYDCLLLENVDM